MTRKNAADPLFFKLFELQPRKGDLRKFEIIKAAIDCIYQEGIQRTNFESIGKHAGITRAHVMYHFKSIDQIISMAVRYITRTAQQLTIDRIKDASTWAEQLRQYIEAALLWANEEPAQASVFMLFYHLSATDSEYRELHAQIRAAGRQRVEAILSPHFREHKVGYTQAQQLCRALHSMIISEMVFRITADEQKDTATAVADVHRTALVLINAITRKA